MNDSDNALIAIPRAMLDNVRKTIASGAYDNLGDFCDLAEYVPKAAVVDPMLVTDVQFTRGLVERMEARDGKAPKHMRESALNARLALADAVIAAVTTPPPPPGSTTP